MKTTSTIQPLPKPEPFITEAEMNALSAIYMLAVITMVIGIGVYAVASFLKQVYVEHKKRQMFREIAKQVGQAMTLGDIAKKQEAENRKEVN